jgi:hypothetical protein
MNYLASSRGALLFDFREMDTDGVGMDGGFLDGPDNDGG